MFWGESSGLSGAFCGESSGGFKVFAFFVDGFGVG